MSIFSSPKIVVLGMMSRMPVAGNIWLVLHYLEGLRRLGFDPYYVEAHTFYPHMLMEGRQEDSAAQMHRGNFHEAVRTLGSGRRPFGSRMGHGENWSRALVDP